MWAALMGCALAAGALLVWRSPPRRVYRTFWYSGGFIQLTVGEPQPRVIRWQDAISLSMYIDRPPDSAPRAMSSTVCDRSGTCLAVGGPLFARRAAQILAPTVVPALIRAFDTNESLSFGGMRIDRSGITDAGAAGAAAPAFTAWQDMELIAFHGRVGIGIWSAGRKSCHDIDLAGVPNGFFAHYVIEHAAVQAGVPVKYGGDRSFGPRLPALGPMSG